MGEGPAAAQPAGAAAGGDPAGRPAGRGQDDHRGQARALAARTRAQARAAREHRRVPARGDRAARSAWASRSTIDVAPASAEQTPLAIARRRARRGASRCLRRADRRHRRPPARRRGDDGRDARARTRRSPIETLFVVDSMAGQDAVNAARAFDAALPLTGVVLTKLDGDARGGAALSVRTSPASRSSSWAWARRPTASSRSSPSAWPRASSAWATCCRWSRR